MYAHTNKHALTRAPTNTRARARRFIASAMMAVYNSIIDAIFVCYCHEPDLSDSDVKKTLDEKPDGSSGVQMTAVGQERSDAAS
jgi:hypothetical protein